MDKILNGNSDNSQYRPFLEELVSNRNKSTALFEPAVFFIASNERILSAYKMGYVPPSMDEALTYFESNFSAQKLKCKCKDSVLLAVPFSAHEHIDTPLYLGVVLSASAKEEPIISYLEGVVTGSGLTTKRLKKKKMFPINELLELAGYQMEFTSLANALNTCYKKNDSGSGKLVIVERSEERFVPLFYPSHWDLDHFDAVFKQQHYESKIGAEPFVLLKDSQLFENNYHYHVICAIEVENKPVSLLLFTFETEHEAQKAKDDYEQSIKEILPILEKAYIQEKDVQEAQRRDILLQVTKKFHSTMDIGEVLGEIVEAIERAYPHYHVHLLLSQEWQVNENVSIKPLKYGTESGNSTAEHAYLTGQIQVDKELEDNSKILYAPLRGKQGVYGVMEIMTSEDVHVPQYEIDFIQMLADTGGNALENAELYQQSRNLIHDLQLINETSHQLNSNLRLADTINFMTQQIIESFKAEEVGFIMFHANGEAVVLDGSTPFFKNEDSLDALEPLIRKVKRDKDPIYIGDTERHEDVQLDFYKSVLMVPMIQNNELKGMVVTVHQSSYHFTFENFKLLQSLVHHSTLAFSNSMLHEELERLVITDHLTKLFSRNHLDERIQESMYKQNQGTFLLLDIDNFKQINDTYGHQVGDDIIIQVANIMKRNIREEDIAARWGGEELAIYFPNIEVKIGQQIAERIVKAVAIETSPRVTVSIGISHWSSRESEVSLKLLFNQADTALYEAKETGKNRVVVK
ncbi:sensor domain-containing diguanylate cyclase [Alkalihalobacillus oceani]|uniref:Sensor domain-containing diguanylate cyclase n=1 Tax=Halalkalibacter oceani TaxID=1653776 RepID=A0A9X2INL3_9BACI|nr:sensor domain-containing diguanylate cyclase [Halalkalibacter oceani]MCM3715009.1 sensor domain-containing diguanylate cyclase [Halalkalibacter oceani]